MRDYEMLLLIRPNLDRDAALEAAKAIAESVQKRGGEVKSSNVWGRRRLAYPIDNQYEASYFLLKLKIPPASLKDIDFELKLNESLLRFLIIKDELVESVNLQGEAQTAAAQPSAAASDQAPPAAGMAEGAGAAEEAEAAMEEVEAVIDEADPEEASAEETEADDVEAEVEASEAEETPS